MGSEDVMVSPWDLKALGRKEVDCLHVDPSLTRPVPAISKAGFNTATMFGRHKSSKKARPLGGEITVQSLQPNCQGMKDLTIKDYAKLFDKYYDAAYGSRVDRMVAKNKLASDPVLDANIDTEIHKRAAREPRAKYLSAALADKYHVPPPPVTGAPPRPPQILGLTMVPTSSNDLSPEQQAHQPQEAHSSARVIELAQTLAEADKYKSQQAEMQARAEEDARRAYVSRAAAPIPASRAFRTTSREQAWKSGNRFGQPGLETPGPGKYEVKWGYFDKPLPKTLLVKPSYKDEATPQKQRRDQGEAAARRQLEEKIQASEQRRPASAMATATGHRVSTGSSVQQRPYSAAASSKQGSSMPCRSSAGWFSSNPSGKRRVSNMDEEEDDDLLEQDAASKPRLSGPNQHSDKGAHMPTFASHAVLFRGAHHVHGFEPPENPTAGTSSFKAVPRPPLLNKGGTEGSHLGYKYFRDDIDNLQRKPAQLVLPFDRQTSRPSDTLSARCSTTSALGPGTYLKGELPATMTGRHVEAGHRGIKHTPDFGKQTSRPGSAPPMRADVHATPVSEAEAQEKLLSMFQDELNPSELIGVQEVQAHTSRDHNRFTRPPSASQQAQMPRGVTSLGPDKLEQYSSTGFSKPIPGGSFTRTSRAQEIQGMRVASASRVIPPASAPLQKIRPMQAADVVYEQVDPTVQGSHPRPPAWKLPPNRAALSRQWVTAAALAYV